jgi:hypothetical protein
MREMTRCAAAYLNKAQVYAEKEKDFETETQGSTRQVCLAWGVPDMCCV